jgi:hypothetical protein
MGMILLLLKKGRCLQKTNTIRKKGLEGLAAIAASTGMKEKKAKRAMGGCSSHGAREALP